MQVTPVGNDAICRQNICGHYNASTETCQRTIDIGIAKGENRLGAISWLKYNPEARCPATPSLFGGSFRSGVGFLFISHTKIGGTEVWSRTLIPRLPEVAGFVCWEGIHATGDMSLLGCPYGVGLEAAYNLAESCHTLVVWGIGAKLNDVLSGLSNPPRIISMSHGDGSSGWSENLLKEQEPWTDQFVYLCKSAKNSLPKTSDPVLIPNAPDPARVVPTQTREEVRQQLGVSPNDTLLVAVSRYSPEKRVDLLMDAVSELPANYHLVAAGSTGGWNDHYGDMLKSKVTDRVRLIDPVDSPANLFVAADAYLAASDQEGYGLSTAEAMLAGVPVISTPVGFLETDPDLAKIVPIESTEWAKAIREDFSDPVAQRKRASVAKHVMQTEHSVEKFVSAWKDLTSPP